MADLEPRNFLQPCLLLLLAERADHGYELASRLRPLHDGEGDSGGVYRALRGMEKHGLVRSEWRTSDVGPARRTYHITSVGLALLAHQVQELQRYRSDFFGRLRELLRDRKDIRVVGDRFVFQSEVLFPSGQATMTGEGLAAIDQLASAIIELERAIPSEIDWALQVDGHTDSRPIASTQFPSNWELSSARATSVVKYLISRGVSPKRLVAAGFGEFQPLEEGTSDEVLRRNRRIELKLTNR